MSTKNVIEEISLSILNDKKEVTSSDISVCIAIRATEVNPWVLSRLNTLLSYFDPKPEFVIVDFGSVENYKVEIKEICDRNKAKYIYVDDQGVFSLSKARNIAAKNIDTDYILFADVDFVYDRRIIQKMTHIINDLDVSSAIRRFFPMPIYHLNKEASEKFELLESSTEKSKYLTELVFLGQQTQFKEVFEFVAPYSNTFLIHKEFFNLSGGYCDEFRGHGSEDFDFLIRLGLLATNIPLPVNLEKDFYGPLKGSFFTDSDYIGFRRYLEVVTAPSESLGLHAFHIWHESPKNAGYWTESNDWKRARFNEAISRYYPNTFNLLNVDYLSRDKRALCLFTDVASWGYFLPLRLLGYKLNTIVDLDNDLILELMSDIPAGVYDRIFIFNPYMKSHEKFKIVLDMARRNDIEITVIERGGLPNSIYYASEVVYGDPIYKDLANVLADYNCFNEKSTQLLIDNLRKGTNFLESQASYEKTLENNAIISVSQNNKFFIPLQLSDDMAVTQFTEGYTSYDKFYNEICEVAKKNPSDIFLIKKHPLSKLNLTIKSLPNIKVVSDNDNVHCLIDIADATIVYNSGVGLLACLHNKATYNIGNAYYCSEGLSTQVDSIAEAISLYKKYGNTTDNKVILKYFDWLIYSRYSWFSAESIIRDFKERKSHGYKNIVVEVLNLDGIKLNTGSRSAHYKFDIKSYLGWKTKLNISSKEKNPEVKVIKKNNINSQKRLPVNNKRAFINKLFGFFLSENKWNKLINNPHLFFADSKSKIIKMIGVFYLN